ncbi:neuromusculin isoform 2-T2 [Glossina fuscipes fuscipes]
MSPHYQRDTLIGFILLIYSLVACSTVLAVDQVISEQEGKTVIVPCPVNREKCGELHSLNWFKGDNRIAAMLLDDSNVTSVAAEFEDRVSVEQNPFRLIIRNLRISDEDIYLCDTTYFIPIETCDNFNGHRVELNVLVPPTEVVILDEKGDRIDNGSIVGPIQERQILKSTCIVRNTRPQPQVGWWRGNKRLTTHSPSYDEQNGLFTATLELSLQLSRDDLGHNIECRVDSAAIPNTLKNQFSVDLQVRPTSITINGVEHHTVQGSKVVLTCDIHGARPPVNLTWYNNTQPISSEDNDISEIRTKAFGKEDGTYHTQSELIFNATRFENDMVFRCEAENIVLQINREKPFTSSMTLEVLYPPVVKVSPLDITVNTSDTVLLNCEYVANPASLTHVVWYRNGDMVNVNDTERYEGGNSENVALVIRSTDKQDIGNYSCQLSNVIGKGISEQQTDLDVQFVPIVEVLMIPEGPVKESDESNVTLFCNILDANPSILSKVRWYANSTLLKELPDCEETREDLCHIDPSKLLLESIGRGFFYNYSCEGYNAAGWGTRSDDKELLVHYEPGPAVVTHFPLIAVKKKSVTFSCSVDDPGYPESNRYRWLRGGRGPLQDVVTKDWTVEPVGLDSRTNYSCYAFNEGGKGVMATVNLEVHAPPFFIKNLPPYTGMLHTSRNANLTCRIECVPRCEISWLKDGVPIDKNDTRYFVKDKYMDASPATGDFESMLSVLHFNMSNWPNKKFDIEGDNANYTCVSTGNTVGPGIKSATYFSIEYAPDNTTVSEEVVYVQEETIPGRVICKSRANPEPTYEWLHNNKTVIRGNALIINTSMMRNDTGRYTCAAFNKHGRNTAETFIDVQYKPRCEIERREIDDRDTLICTAYGNPEEADFSWSIKAENESVEWLGSGDNKASKDKSFYILTEDYAIARTYRCVANNTAGAGQFCEVEVAAGSAFYIWWREQLAWWQRWDKTTLIILVASILVLLLAVIIICCIIICICRRRRRQDKSVQEKSSSMADPLTEPGEYENLPFHGLQTAPNKFTTPTTPTNFNNNTNVVRSVPRPKRLNGNISQIQGQQQQQHPQYPHHYQQQQHQHAAYYDEQESETGQQQQQQYYHLQQQQQQQLQQEQAYNTFAKHTAQQQHQQQQPSTSSSILAGLPTIISQSNNSSTSNCNGRIMLSNAATEDGVIVHTNSNSLNANSATSSITAHNSASSITNPHQQMPYNLNNCFPKSYTEYYQTQQQQQQQQFTSKFAINNMANATHAQMLNAIEHDYNAFNAGVALVTEGNTKATNPFLAVSNFKKFNQPSSVEASTMEGYNTTSMKRIGKRKTFVDKLEDKRFYSLKFSSGGKNKAQNSKTIGNGEDSSSRTGVVGVLGPLITDSNNKCKRHHSFAGGSVGDIDPKGPSRNPLHFYDTPAYENVNDAVQVHTSNTKSSDMEMQAPALSSSMGTATVLLHPLPHHTVHVNGGLGASSTTGPKKKHHQRQHQPKEDLNLIEPERSSIYRSDSGISNSSYECVTPVPSHGAACSTPPPGKTPRAPKTPKTPKTHKTNSLIHSTVTANFNSAHKKQAPRVPPTPLYINVNSDSTASPISNLERPSSPNSAVATSAYESASSSQNDGTCADPASLSSCTSLYSGKVTSVSRCSRHQQPPEITTPEEYEQYQLGHHPHGGHSSSSLSVASSVSGTGVNASAWSKCKKQQRSTVTSNVTSLELTNKYRLDTNPFLAANTTASTTAPTTICRKKLRRQTISDPYAHIKYISDCRKQHLRLNTVTASKQNRLGGINETHNYCSESTSAFKATTAAANVDKSQQQQQINLQPYNAIDYVKQSELHQSHHRHHDHPHCYEQLQQQQHQQQQQLGFTHSQHTQQMLMSSSGNIDDIDDDGNNDRPYNDRKYSPHSCYLSYSHDDNDNYNYIEEIGETAETLRSSQIMLTTDRKLPETTNTATIPSTLIDFTARPIKLPLRKYHSFHFQTSQTVAGQQQGNLKMRQQEQLQAQAYTAEHPVKHHYSKEGPLVFLPLCLNENSTFKPIVSTEESEGDDSTEISINDELEQYSKSTPIANLIRCTSSLNIKNSELNNQSPTIDKSITKLSKAFTIAKREPYEQIDKSKENTATVVKPISKSKNLLLSRIINNSPEVIKIQDFTNSNRDEIYITSKTLIRSPPVLKTKNMSTQSKGKAEASAEIFKKDVCEPNLLKSEQMTRGSPSQIGREENEFVKDIKLSSNTALFKAGSFKDDSNRFALNEGKFEYNARMDVNPENKNLTFSGQCFQTLNHKKNIGKFPDASKCIDMYKVMPESLACTGSNKGCPTLPSLKSMTEDCNEKSNQTHDNTFSTRNIKSPLTPLKTLKLMTKSNPELWYNTHTGNRQKLHQLQLFHSMQNLKNSHKSNRNTSADVVDTEQEAEDEEDLGYTFYEDENDNDINDNDINDNDK